MSLCLYYSQEVPSKTPSRKEHFISLAWKYYVQVDGFLEIRNTLKTEEKVGNLFLNRV